MLVRPVAACGLVLAVGNRWRSRMADVTSVVRAVLRVDERRDERSDEKNVFQILPLSRFAYL